MASNENKITTTESIEIKEYVSPRVTILDAHEIDDDLHRILKFQLSKVLKYIPNWVLSKFNHEIDSIFKLFLLKLCLDKHGSTFVQKMFQLRYSNESCANSWKMNGFAVSSVLSDYVSQKSDDISMHFREQSRNAYVVYKYVDICIDLIKFVNLIAFLNRGTYYSVLERIFQMRLISKTKAPRSIEYNYLSRELLHQSIMEFLVAVLPILQSHLLQRKFANLFFTKKYLDLRKKGEVPTLNLNTKCNACKQFPWQPHHIECKHVFCYYCIIVNCKLSDDRFECIVCSHQSDKLHSFAQGVY